MEDPKSIDMPSTIGPYSIVKVLGSGGMGEVFLAYDPTYNRNIALKRMKKDLQSNPELRKQFLNEARLTGQMSHPAIVPIFTVVEEKDLVYYTMPYVEGKMLKSIFELGCEQEQSGEPPDYLTTVPALTYIFLEICRAVAYSHSKGIIHRDLKPSNIMVGDHGQTVILDWGLIKFASQEKEEKATKYSQGQEVEKIAGTLIYAAPELLAGEPASFQTEVYSLGLILYQMLTLRYPFHRHSLEEYRLNQDKEILVDPAKVAPFRQISPIIAQIAFKCLAPSKQDRYQTVDELIRDLENYLKIHSDWFLLPKIDVNNAHDWNIVEGMLIHKRPFSSIIHMEAKIKIDEKGTGIGFLTGLSDPTKEDPHAYFLWIGSEAKKNTYLQRWNRRLIESKLIFLTPTISHQIIIEKIEGSFYLYLDGELQLSFMDYNPQSGPYFGIIFDKNYIFIEELTISIFGDFFQTNPLAIGNAFLETKNDSLAFREFHRIMTLFPYSYEGSKAIFKSGLAFLNEKNREIEAFETFSSLRGSPGAPLEYLGKSLIYRSQNNGDKEIDCLDQALALYFNHPLFSLLKNHIIFRLQESAYKQRKAHYALAYLTCRYIPQRERARFMESLYENIKSNWEALYFIDENRSRFWDITRKQFDFISRLSFWLDSPGKLCDIIDEMLKLTPTPLSVLTDALFELVELGQWELAQKKIDVIKQTLLDIQAVANLDWIQEAIFPHLSGIAALSSSFLASLPKKLEVQHLRTAIHIFNEALRLHQTDRIYSDIAQLKSHGLTPEQNLQLDEIAIWARLLDRNWSSAKEILDLYPDKKSLLFFLYGCWLAATEGKEAAFHHFALLNSMPFPPSWALFCQFGQNQTGRQVWEKEAFLWEKQQFSRQSALFYSCFIHI